jgi:hypothetical protein
MVAFVSTSRDHRTEQLRLANASTGEVKEVLQESVATFYESGNDRANWRYLPASNEVIWFSERDNWGQLYLFDLRTGREKHRITSGDGNVTQLLRVDEKNRVLYFLAVGKERGDPYFRHLYRIDFDGHNQRLLTPADADHDVTMSPGGAYFVDVSSTPDTPPVAELRDASGKMILSSKRPTSPNFPRPAGSHRSHHGEGPRRRHRSMRPALQADDARSTRSIKSSITFIGPSDRQRQRTHVFVGARRCPIARRARVRGGRIDGMGTPWRRKHSTRRITATWRPRPDQVTGMKQLAARYPWIDIDRPASTVILAVAMRRRRDVHYPDFFKVGI